MGSWTAGAASAAPASFPPRFPDQLEVLVFAWKRGALILALLAANGCYVYQPVRPGDAMLDARVRATVSAEKAAELAPAMRGISTQLRGTLTERDAEGVLLEVPLFGGTAGMSSQAHPIAVLRFARATEVGSRGTSSHSYSTLSSTAARPLTAL